MSKLRHPSLLDFSERPKILVEEEPKESWEEVAEQKVSSFGDWVVAIFLDKNSQHPLLILMYALFVVDCSCGEQGFVSWKTLIVFLSNIMGYYINLTLIVPPPGQNPLRPNIKEWEPEKRRLIQTLILFSLRFYLLDHKILLVPLSIVLVTSANRLHQRNRLWGISSSLYTALHFLAYGMHEAYVFVGRYGFGMEVISSIIICASILIALMLYTYHLFTIIAELKNQVGNLEKTRGKLESAILARNQFISHISHEFR